ncbi:MAG: hydrogenase iron-sulfur subunit, partial [Desulfobulbaceae bacterium]|nr:hydrogenase iron-sulfur subunit [Desulfobulbaceae bacterium]
MRDMKIILFLCSWGPHAAYQTLQDSTASIPGDVKMVRIPCTGRISKALLLKSFEMGADGVALVGCEPGTCRYGTGTDNAHEHVKDSRGILDLLGLGRNRLRLATFLPDESEKLLTFLTEFTREIAEMGESPVIPVSGGVNNQETDRELGRILSSHDVYACQDCGKCSSACPLTLSGKVFSPRAMAGAVISGRFEDSGVKKDVWSCLTCGLCYDRCPSGVNFSEFVRDLRVFLQERSVEPHLSHGGFFQSLMRTMTSENLPISHWEWLPSDIQSNPESKTLFFGGCPPY